MPKNTHYVYKLINPLTEEFYIGVRSCNGSADDDSYMGSMYTWKVDKGILVKIIIDDTFRTRLEANAREKELISENISNRLNRNYHIPQVGFCWLGATMNENHRKKLSESKRKLYIDNPNIIQKNIDTQKNRWTDEMRKQWSTKMKQINSTVEYRNKQIHSASDKVKKVVQLSKNGEFIRDYDSINDAARQLHIDKTCISRCCNGRYKTAFGYVWKFK